MSVVVGPVLSFALIFTTLPLIWINLLGALVFSLLIPYVAIGETLLYFDLRPAPRARASSRAAPGGPGIRAASAVSARAAPGSAASG